MSNEVMRIFIAGDWDADGVVATALLMYSQEVLRKYPFEADAVIDKAPLDPDRIKYLLTDFKGGYDAVIFLDIPYNEVLGNVMRMLKEHFGIKTLMFFDHHITSIQKELEIKGIADYVVLDYRVPTASLVFEELRKRNISVHQRLRSFVEVVEYMDSGKRVPDHYLKLFEITKMFSKALTAIRDAALWSRIAEWLATPTPLPMPLDEALWAKVKQIIEERDKEVKEVAMEIALSSVKIGDFRFIDARKKWRKRGVTALASKLSTILKAPVILLAGTNRRHYLLVIKASRGRAYRIAKSLVGEGIACDIAGHPNLAIVRVPDTTDMKELMDALHNAVYYSS